MLRWNNNSLKNKQSQLQIQIFLMPFGIVKYLLLEAEYGK